MTRLFAPGCKVWINGLTGSGKSTAGPGPRAQKLGVTLWRPQLP